jgi:hypothetical protein
VEEIRDVDGDGRPDIITHEPYVDSATINCGSGDGYSVYGPALLVHSLPDGTFSSVDAQAMLFAKRECAVKPSPVILISEYKATLRSDGWTGRLVLYARADIDGDGLEDLLVRRDGHATGGTAAEARVFVVTQLSPTGCTRVVCAMGAPDSEESP